VPTPLVTLPPFTLSVPVPLKPIVRSVLFAHVPLLTVAVPTLPTLSPIEPDELVTLPPVTFSVPVPLTPTKRLPLVAHVPLLTVAVPLPVEL